MKTYKEIKLAQELIRFPTVKTEDKEYNPNYLQKYECRI